VDTRIAGSLDGWMDTHIDLFASANSTTPSRPKCADWKL